MASLIAADNLCVIRNNTHILDHVSLAVEEGEFVTLIGPNGAGKTMLLHALLGFFPTDHGAITRKPDLRVGYVPQRLIPDATLPITSARFLKSVKGANAASVREALELAEAADLAESPLHVLSGGELQRVLLARALIGSPDLLVLDEPAQNLDIGGQLAFYKLLESIYARRKCAVLMVSHDLHMVMASTRRVVCLFRHICCSGAPSVVARDPEFVALFGADMARMMAVYNHAHTHTHDIHDHGDAHHDH